MSAVIYECVLPAVARSVSRVRHELDDALIAAGVAGARRPDIGIVMSEAATNVVLHAYPALLPGLLFVDAAVAGRDLVVRVCDSGGGMVPRIDSPGLGVGLTLMARFADGLEITHNNSLAGTRVEALFRDVTRADPAPASPRPATEEFDDYVSALATARAWQSGHAGELRVHARHALDDAHHLRAERVH